MKTILQPRLVNNPFGDPGLIIEFLFDKRALLFDLGHLGPLTSQMLLKISDVFVSHTHIDHFIGFDRLLRVVFGRGKTIHLFGPANFIANVEGKLAGFTWNLVDRYSESVTLEVTEVHADRLIKARFSAIDRFQKSDELIVRRNVVPKKEPPDHLQSVVIIHVADHHRNGIIGVLSGNEQIRIIKQGLILHLFLENP